MAGFLDFKQTAHFEKAWKAQAFLRARAERTKANACATGLELSQDALEKVI